MCLTRLIYKWTVCPGMFDDRIPARIPNVYPNQSPISTQLQSHDQLITSLTGVCMYILIIYIYIVYTYIHISSGRFYQIYPDVFFVSAPAPAGMGPWGPGCIFMGRSVADAQLQSLEAALIHLRRVN